MTDEKYNWDDYYKWMQGREPRQLLLEALKKFPAGELLHAIDLGCGDGTETVVLLHTDGMSLPLMARRQALND